MLGLGAGEILVIAVALTLLFGARKLPSLARGLGQGIRNFKGELGSGRSADREELPEPEGDGEQSDPRQG